MSGNRLGAALACVPPVDLAGLDAVAPLLWRRDRKYVVPVADAVRLLGLLPTPTRVLTIDGKRSFRYESIYFDTPNLDLYLAAARRRPRRYKVRTRAYVDAGRRLLEVKRRDARGRTVKERIEHRAERADELDDESLRFLRQCPWIRTGAEAFQPVLRTGYLRSTLLVDECARVTIDVDVSARTGDCRIARLVDMAVIETKSNGRPTSVDRTLWDLGHRPTRVSKYCTSLAALRPDLPSNRWTQALRKPWPVTDEIPKMPRRWDRDGLAKASDPCLRGGADTRI